MFQSISRSEVRQQSGRRHLNAGELAFEGVTALKTALGVLPTDVFADIGCGIGNVLVQLALESPASRLIGLEVRADLVQLGQSAILTHEKLYRQLSRVELRSGSIEDSTSWPLLCDVTIAFASNKLFEETANQGIEDFVSQTQSLRRIVLGNKLCYRHRQNCSRPFCKQWREVGEILVAVRWTGTKQSMFIYEKSNQ